jgi:hypothetical protein
LFNRSSLGWSKRSWFRRLVGPSSPATPGNALRTACSDWPPVFFPDQLKRNTLARRLAVDFPPIRDKARTRIQGFRRLEQQLFQRLIREIRRQGPRQPHLPGPLHVLPHDAPRQRATRGSRSLAQATLPTQTQYFPDFPHWILPGTPCRSCSSRHGWKTTHDTRKGNQKVPRGEKWPHPEIEGRAYPKQVAATKRFTWPRSAEMKRRPRPKQMAAPCRNQWPRYAVSDGLLVPKYALAQFVLAAVPHGR